MSFVSLKSAVSLSLSFLLGATLVLGSPVKVILRPAEGHEGGHVQRILGYICIFYNVKDQGSDSWDIFYSESGDNSSFEFIHDTEGGRLSLAKLSYMSEMGVLEVPFTNSDLERATHDEEGTPVVTLTYTSEHVMASKYGGASEEGKGAVVEGEEPSNAEEKAVDPNGYCLLF